jgi:hypothetical protein
LYKVTCATTSREFCQTQEHIPFMTAPPFALESAI